MAYKFALALTFAVVAALVGQARAGSLALVELNDANKNAMNYIDLSKALGTVQDAYTNEFRFESTTAIRKFLFMCEVLDGFMTDAQDSDFGGLAKQMKTIVAEPSIKSACSFNKELLTGDFDELDTLINDNIHYTKAFNLLTALNDKVNADPTLRQLAAHMVKSKAGEVAAKLMGNAPEDIELLIGETKPNKDHFDFEVKYHKFCKTSLIAPICKLVRNTPLEVSAIAADFEKFTAALKSGAAEVAEHTQNSGVSLDELKAKCSKLERPLKPIGQIEKYLEAGLLSEETLAAYRETSPSLDSYVALYDLCKVAGAQ